MISHSFERKEKKYANGFNSITHISYIVKNKRKIYIFDNKVFEKIIKKQFLDFIGLVKGCKKEKRKKKEKKSAHPVGWIFTLVN